MLVWLLLAALCALVMFPETAIGKGLRRGLVETPARWLSRLTPGRIALALTLVGISLLVALVFETEGLRLLGMALPEALTWVAAFDIATFLDLFALVALAAASARVQALRDTARSAIAWISTRGSRTVGAARRIGRARQRRVRRPKAPPARGDDGAAGWTPAWA